VTSLALLSKQHAAIAAVGIVTIDAQSFRGRVLLEFGRFLVAGEANLLLWHHQIQRSHVALSLCQVADGARNRHRRMHRLAAGLVGVTGRTKVILVENAGMLDCKRRQRRQQN